MFFVGLPLLIHFGFAIVLCTAVGAKFHESSLEEQEVRAYREIERKNMHKMLDEYLLFCQQMRVYVLLSFYHLLILLYKIIYYIKLFLK